MKYPQLLSLPSAVQDWFEEQLEAHGIDSLVYSRYILSLLQHETFDQPDELPQSVTKAKSVGGGRSRRSSRRQNVAPQECSATISTESIKRTAAIRCLMEASEQHFGIESLVDELCAKLKAIQRTTGTRAEILPGASHHSEGEPDETLSQDLALKYYAAFPPLSGKASLPTDSSTLLNTNCTTVWNKKRVFSSSFSRNQALTAGAKEEFREFSWFEEDKENQVRNKDVLKMRSRSMVKQQHSEGGKTRRSMAKSLDRKDECEFGKGSTRLYQTEKALSTKEKQNDDLSGCDQDLPMDFQQLLESPDDSDVGFDLYKQIAGKQLATSFIQCGTNITSSIWTDNGRDNISMDCGEAASSDLPLKSEWSVWNNATMSDAKVWSDVCSTVSSGSWRPQSNGYISSASGWADVESTSLLLKGNDNFYSVFDQNFDLSLASLNHTQNSHFIEVVPTLRCETKLRAKMSRTEPDTVKSEEDLLTSMRTHFLPIREEVPAERTQVCPRYVDGTTFAISTSLKELPFRRSESGSLYLDTEVGSRKYMEFKEKEMGSPLLRASVCHFIGSEMFVPKFQVHGQEKFCQTDGCAEAELFFPGDDTLARDLVSSLVDDDGDSEVEWVEPQEVRVDGWVTAWPINNSAIWSSENKNKHWCDWSKTGPVCAPSEAPLDQYVRLRDELLEEGEELLSDLSSMQYLFLTSDESRPIDQPVAGGLSKPNSIAVSAKLEWKPDERHISLKTVQNERKRRHSSSQRICNSYLSGNCEQIHCRFSHTQAAIPCRFWADASCLKGDLCPFSHARPLTL